MYCNKKILLLNLKLIIFCQTPMQTILVAGAGKSSTYLIHYLLSNAQRNKWKVIVADGDEQTVREKTKNHPSAEIAVIDISSEAERAPLVKRADIVVSLMPPHLHIHLAKDCLAYKKHLITSSYVSPEIREMDKAVKEAGLMFMCEMGLDPGIDHMTANQIIHSIQRVASTVTSFKSYCGGLVAPESDDNPWHYKFSWNPRNIVTAGLGGAHYLHNGKEVEVPYETLFDNAKRINVAELGYLASYPNRDSLRYLELYDVPEIKTFLRGTLRHPNFCRGWHAVIALGLTNQDDVLNSNVNTYADWLKQKTAYADTNMSLTKHVSNYLKLDQDDKVVSMLEWLGLFENNAIPSKKTNSADTLLDILLDKWEMQPGDKDMVVMQHEIEYFHKGLRTKCTSSMIVKGENREMTAMAKTVGMPMAILAKMILANKVKPVAGVHIPNMSSIYRPLLTELHHHGIEFKDVVE